MQGSCPLTGSGARNSITELGDFTTSPLESREAVASAGRGRGSRKWGPLSSVLINKDAWTRHTATWTCLPICVMDLMRSVSEFHCCSGIMAFRRGKHRVQGRDSKRAGSRETHTARDTIATVVGGTATRSRAHHLARLPWIFSIRRAEPRDKLVLAGSPGSRRTWTFPCSGQSRPCGPVFPVDLMA